MIFEKVIYQRLFSLPNYENERLTIEGSLEVDEDVTTAFLQAKDQAFKSFKAMNPHLDFGHVHETRTSPIIEQPLQSIDPKKRDETEIAIDNATSPEELHRIYEDAEKYGLTEQWKDKMVLLPFPQPNTD